ncbi:MAG: hypothetical protein K8R44_06300 [Sulfurimonas sp.]|jgi:uncharacterized protein|nr:hypothetical protein [Sulfurimonas sp.]
MILKVLLVIVVIAVVYFMFIKKKPLKNSANKKHKKSEEPQVNDMVECCACGTYTELQEAILSNNKYYCSEECVGKA